MWMYVSMIGGVVMLLITLAAISIANLKTSTESMHCNLGDWKNM